MCRPAALGGAARLSDTQHERLMCSFLLSPPCPPARCLRCHPGWCFLPLQQEAGQRWKRVIILNAMNTGSLLRASVVPLSLTNTHTVHTPNSQPVAQVSAQTHPSVCVEHKQPISHAEHKHLLNQKTFKCCWCSFSWVTLCNKCHAVISFTLPVPPSVFISLFFFNPELFGDISVVTFTIKKAHLFSVFWVLLNTKLQSLSELVDCLYPICSSISAVKGITYLL